MQDFEHEVKITASFIEIYNEYIYDLLKPKNKDKDYLELWDDPTLGTVIAGVKEFEVTNISSVKSNFNLDDEVARNSKWKENN
jgi:Kinesin motor domain